MRTNHHLKKQVHFLMEETGLSYAAALKQVQANVPPQGPEHKAIYQVMRSELSQPGMQPADLARAVGLLWKGVCSNLHLAGDPTKARYMKVHAGTEVARQLDLANGGKVRILGVSGRGHSKSFQPYVDVETSAGYPIPVYLTEANSSQVSFH